MRRLSSYSVIHKSVPFMLEYHRVLRLLSLAELEEMTGISAHVLRNFELGIAIPSKDMFDKIVKALELP